MNKTLQVEAGDRVTFRGCLWDDGWEFDAPCVLYWPVKRYRDGGNTGAIDCLVEDVCGDLMDGSPVETGWSASDLHEFKWRHWSPRGFAQRRQAWHVEIVVEFYDTEDGLWSRDIVRRERYGLDGPWEEKRSANERD